MNIHRDKYLQKLINRMNNGLIKLVTGIRHSGKSYLIFNIFKNYLLKNKVDEDHIITVELDRVEYVHYREPLVILDYIKSQIKDDKNYYILLDEVQMLKQLEAVLDSLWSINNVDIYLTLSNTNYLSGDILRDFMGRCDEIHVYPLTFKEFSNVYNGERVWKNYYTYGGLPLVCTMETEEEKTEYLTNLFEESYIKDILERNSIEKTEELNDLINILAS
ncbi:MAG: AAA family ATPase, partial [Christensenellaceae bacterium]|nr:AAA family ATPase [Christensenellaceae bacterium]